MSRNLHTVQHQVTEWSFDSAPGYEDPFNDIELDALIEHGDAQWRVPAYWAGGNEWRVRFAPPSPGRYTFETQCTDTANAALHGRRGELEATAYTGDNPLLSHGSLRVSENRRHFEFDDGTPFFWLGDTWWMGLCKRWSWPEDFQTLTADRVAKGFTVIQIIAGLYPDMPPFDERGANEAGFPWKTDYARINPAYFDMADLRMQWLVRSGLMPCIVGCWGYFLPWMGQRKMKQHWRNLVARWGASPVTWCLAGEAAMPYYLSEDKEGDAAAQIDGWTELARYVKAIDPFHRPITIHPTGIGRDQVRDDTALDYDMLQTGHGGPNSAANHVTSVRKEVEREPHMPVLVGEVNYEGILHGTGAEMQRYMFWSAVLSGAAGHTYGANGMWQVNTEEKPFGPSPHGGNWGTTPWQDAYQLPGSVQLGMARALLERYPWARFEPHPDWVEPSAGEDNMFAPHAAGVPRLVRVVYIYWPSFPWSDAANRVVGFEPDVRYEAFFFDPRDGHEVPLGEVQPEADGRWPIPCTPTMTDWVLVLEARD